MKKHYFTGLILSMLFCLMVFIPFCHVSAEATTEATTTETSKTVKVPNGLVKENGKYHYYKNGKLVKKQWKTIKKAKYYFDKNGDAVVGSYEIKDVYYVFQSNGKLFCPKKPRLTQVGEKYLLADEEGKAVKGWNIVDGKLYCMNRKGVCQTDKKIDGIQLSKKGVAKKSNRTKLKMKVIQIVDSITTDDMTKSQKLRACWNYMVSRSRFRYSSAKYPKLNKSGWYRDTAYDMLTTRRGNCYSFACAFAALADQVGYDCKVICGRVSGSRDHASDGLTRHSWVQIGGRNYDPEGQFAGWKRGVYGLRRYTVRHTIQRRVAFQY